MYHLMLKLINNNYHVDKYNCQNKFKLTKFTKTYESLNSIEKGSSLLKPLNLIQV